jgi:predicted 3-demethylubiquinone-9 3-methyltransferase (glyoxalase superfamily)
MQKITPFLWYDGQAEQAAELYTSVFKNSKVNDVTRYGKGAPIPAGTAMTVSFELDGQPFIALNGGRAGFTFTEATSFYVNCETQDEVDYLWERLTEDGGEPGNCGWLKDKFGVSWQIAPSELQTLLTDPDPERAARAMQAMLGMNKIDIQAMRDAADGKPAA